MPNIKQFEAISLEELIFGGDIKYLTMEEMSEVFFNNIKSVYTFLIEGKTVSMEVPNDECLYHITKLESNFYKLEKMGNDNAVSCFTPIEFVNWLFKTAPFISMVGYDNTPRGS